MLHDSFNYKNGRQKERETDFKHMIKHLFQLQGKPWIAIIKLQKQR